MHLDILIFVVIAAFLIYRLNSVLGSRHGDERERPNPFARKEDTPLRPLQKEPPQSNVQPLYPSPPVTRASAAPLALESVIDADANREGSVEEGLNDILGGDPLFGVNTFIQGARYAFEEIVTAFAKGDLETLRPLLSPKLYADFQKGIADRKLAGHAQELSIHRVKQALIRQAKLNGVMAYIDVAFEAEETRVTRDAQGQVVEGDADSILTVRDLWTFTRDVRSNDPNWTLIETRALEKHES